MEPEALWLARPPLTARPGETTLELLLRDLRHQKARAAADLADWLVRLDVENKADRTILGYHRYLAELLRLYPDVALDEFTASQIEDALRRHPRRSRHIVRSVYNQFFAWAEMMDRIPRSPMNKVARIPHPKRRPKDIFSEAEQALLENLPSPDGELWTILFGSGIRRGEARRLQLCHVNLARHRLTIYQGKGDKDRIIPVPPIVLAAVANLELWEQLGPDDHLWYTRRGVRRLRTSPISDTTFERWYSRGIEDAGVRYLNPHQTRHTYGHRLRERGFELEERRLLMGHESILTTDRYYGTVTVDDVAAKIAEL